MSGLAAVRVGTHKLEMNSDKKTTMKKTVKRDPVQEQREAFIQRNTEPGQPWWTKEVIYREAVARFPYPDQGKSKGKTVYLD